MALEPELGEIILDNNDIYGLIQHRQLSSAPLCVLLTLTVKAGALGQHFYFINIPGIARNFIFQSSSQFDADTENYLRKIPNSLQRS